MDDLKKLDGVAAYNRQEPTFDDLERVGKAYNESLRTIDSLQSKVSELEKENEKLKSERDFYRRGRDWLQDRCSIAEENEAKLKVDLESAREVIHKALDLLVGSKIVLENTALKDSIEQFFSELKSDERAREWMKQNDL